MSISKDRLKQKAYSELKEFFVIVLYLWIVRALFLVYKSMLLKKEHISYLTKGIAIINALVLGKVILVGRALHLGERYNHLPLIPNCNEFSGRVNCGEFFLVHEGSKIKRSVNPKEGRRRIGGVNLVRMEFRPAKPCILPTDRDALIVTPVADVSSIAITAFERLMLRERNRDGDPDARTSFERD